MKKLIVILTLLAAPLWLTSCNTVQGMGQDITAGGRALEKATNN
jgi:predicted small secreted protein